MLFLESLQASLSNKIEIKVNKSFHPEDKCETALTLTWLGILLPSL